MSLNEEVRENDKDVKRVRAGYLANATRKLREFYEVHLNDDK